MERAHRTAAWRHGFSMRAFLCCGGLALLVLSVAVMVPQWLSTQARLEVLRKHVAQVARAAASVVDGDLHRELLDPAAYTDERYARALAPLLRFHSASPELYYVYTMLDRDGETFFILDTATSEALDSAYELKGSPYMERFVVFPEYLPHWHEQVERREPWVYPFFQHDDYGYFLSGHAPIFDSQGRYAGFAGVDFGIDYYVALERRFRLIGYGSLAAVVLISALLGLLCGRHYHQLQRQLDARYRAALRDELTGLFNRRGLLQRLAACLRLRGGAGHALLYVKLPGLRTLRREGGHAAADRELCAAADLLRDLARDRDAVARPRGDALVLLTPETGLDTAATLARRLLAILAERPQLQAAVGLVPGEPGVDAESLLRRAEAAARAAVAEGGERYRVEDGAHPLRAEPA